MLSRSLIWPYLLLKNTSVTDKALADAMVSKGTMLRIPVIDPWSADQGADSRGTLHALAEKRRRIRKLLPAAIPADG